MRAFAGRRFVALLLLLAASCAGEDRWLLEVRNEQRPWAIHGTVVGDDRAEEAWVVFHRGVIVYVGPDASALPPGVRRIEYRGYIFPGLIDTHNHAPWNTIPRWRADHPFHNRYEWQADPDYLARVNDVFYKKIREAGLEDIALKYAEVRALIGGTTLLQSTYKTPVPRDLVRNLDANLWADSRIPDIRKIEPDEVRRFQNGLSEGSLRRVFVHIAEGQASDPSTREEFGLLESKGLARPGVVIIHGVGLKREDFRTMAERGMYLVWSPRSNEVLYGETADVQAALEEGVPVALAPDWTISGSNNVLEEMKTAWAYSRNHLKGKIGPAQLFRMVTSDAARVGGVNSFLGRIAPRYAADLVLAPRRDADPYRSLLATEPRDLSLVFVDGVPLYGDLEELRKWVRPQAVDEIMVQGAKKGVVTLGDPLQSPVYDQRFPQIESALKAALPNLAPLFEN